MVFGKLEPTRRRLVSVFASDAKIAANFGLDEEAEHLTRVSRKLDDCARSPILDFNGDTSEWKAVECRCKHRLCPRCSKFRSEDLRRNLQQLVQRFDSPRLMTLTLKSCDDHLRDQIKRLTKSFCKLRRTKTWKNTFHSGIWTFEVTYNHSNQMWHPHIHALLDGRYINHQKLSAMWRKATGDSHIVDIRLARSREQAIQYITKYVAKVSDATKLPDERLSEWALAVRGLRLVSTIGLCRNVKLEKEKPEPQEGFETLGYACVLEAEAQNGDQEAERLYNAIIDACQRGIPNTDDPRLAEIEATNRDLADSFRTWISNREENYGDAVPKKSSLPRTGDHSGNRTEWLWKNTNSALAFRSV